MITVQTSQILGFFTPLLFVPYDVWGGTHNTLPLNTKQDQEHSQILPLRDAWDKEVCSAGKETFFLTDSSRPVAQECTLQVTSNAA